MFWFIYYIILNSKLYSSIATEPETSIYDSGIAIELEASIYDIVLPLSNLICHDNICIAWTSKWSYTPSDIFFFAYTWRIRVWKVIR